MEGTSARETGLRAGFLAFHVLFVVSPNMATKDDSAKEDGPTSLDRRRAGMFLDALARDPFVAVVVAEDGEICIYSKDMSPKHLERIQAKLIELKEGE